MKLNQRKFSLKIAVFAVIAILMTFICVNAFAAGSGADANGNGAEAQAQQEQQAEEKSDEGVSRVWAYSPRQ